MYWQKKWSSEDKDQALKDEILAIRQDHKDYGYRSREELVRTIEDFIRYYNNDRIKEKLGGLSPKQYRERMTSA